MQMFLTSSLVPSRPHLVASFGTCSAVANGLAFTVKTWNAAPNLGTADAATVPGPLAGLT